MRKKFNGYWVTIGLEIHISLQTQEKLFSATKNTFDNEGEFQLFDAGVPGILPRLGKEPVEMAIAFGLATNSEVRKESFFDRKHYMYPDLPLGYQITQQYKPILWAGEVDIQEEDGTLKTVKIEHSHLECDAAKSLHDVYSQYTAIDLSRCSAPLLEVVSTPCMYSPHEAREYAKKVYEMAVFMGICDGKIEEGSFRVDASISLNTDPDKLGTRVEIKNISSFNFLEEALKYEIQRQSEALDSGKDLVMETRLFNEKDMETKSMRKKETVDEYRYLPCPDIPMLLLTDEMIDDVKSKYDVKFFDYVKQLSVLFERFAIKFNDDLFSAYWKPFTSETWKFVLLNEQYQTERAIRLLAFWSLEVLDGTKILDVDTFKEIYSSSLQAKEIKDTLTSWQGDKSEKSVKDFMPSFMDEADLKLMVEDILLQFEEAISKYKAGDEKVANFLVGKVMAATKGKAPAQVIKETVLSYLKSL